MTHDQQAVETEYLTIHEAAALLRVPVATLRWWRSQLIGPPSRKFGRHVRYGKRELLTWADLQGRPGGHPAA
jgi:DNA-binding transcriptional MerR regulator